MRMRKFTLFFMSMFLVLGTAIAKDEVQDFNSPTAYPSSDNPQTSVWNIRLTFPKEITVVQSEVNIDIVNNKTNETVKITSCNVDEWDNHTAVFNFEKKVVEGKDGEELVDQPIEAPGTYTYTIPAGIIKSVDEEEYAGGEFSFTVVSTFAIESHTPQTTDKIEEIVFTCSEEISEIKVPEEGWILMGGYYWSDPIMAISNAEIGEDKKTVVLKLSEPITAIGSYMLNIYMGNFVSAESVNEYYSAFIDVVSSAPSFSTNYQNGDRVKELGNLEITFSNVEKVELLNSDAISVFLPSQSKAAGKATLADNKITVAFDKELTEEGNYTFFIPAGTFTMDGVENEAREVTVELFTFTITPLEVVSVTPAVGAVDSLERIVVTFNQIVSLSWTEDWMSQPSSKITLTCGEEKITLTHAGGSAMSDQVEYLVNAEWDGYQWTTTPITAAGTYTLNLADIIVDYAAEMITDSWGTYVGTWHGKNGSCEGTYTWTIAEEDNAVNFINTEAGEQVIYDLLGRRVEKTTTGIYIVNGRKVIIK